ncbi:hypothetical protein HWV62_41850 [Athelia sp. TMB]|nr:hypothetical protein HWV62_41850 [Athelia sp. TMB]
MANSVLELKADIWLSVSLLLPVIDLLRLQATCKHLRDLLSLDYVWSSALKDIMTTVTFPDHSSRNLSLSSLELKHRAVLAARVERYWGQPKVLVTPRNLQSLPTRDGVIKARLVKGGQWIVLLLTDGTLCLQAAAADAPCVVDSSFKTLTNSYVWMTLSLSAGMPRETLVLLRTSKWDAIRGSPSTTIAIYCVDTNTSKPCFRMLKKVTQHHSAGAYETATAAEGNLWAFGWSHDGRQLLSVKNILWNQDDVEKEVVFDIGEPIHATLSLLSATQVLVTSCHKISLYEIPPLQLIIPGQLSPIIQREPIWTRTFQDNYNYPPVGPICWDADSGRHESVLAMITGDNLRFFTPSPGHPSIDSFQIRTYSDSEMATRPALSDRRAIWSAGDELFMCTFPMQAGGDAGRLRLGMAEPGASVRIAGVEMPAQSVDGQICDLSWDETAGRLCLLVESQRVDSKFPSLKIMIIDAL